MKKLILKTAAITLAAALALGALLLAIFSFTAPALMMDFTASLGMVSVSGNFAYEEYERSGDIDCLARSFIIAAESDEESAMLRWEKLYGDARFAEYCDEQKTELTDVPAYRYRDFLTGTAARLMYRRAASGEAKTAALGFAISETDVTFPAGNPTIALASEASERSDTAFLKEILAALGGENFEHSEQYTRLTQQLEEIAT